ncbi:MAG: hypothetical protein ACR2NP_04225 [Pirellulaceae bacterium]
MNYHHGSLLRRPFVDRCFRRPMNETPTQPPRTTLSAQQLSTLAVLASATLFCVTAIAIRVIGDNSLTELFLLLASLTCAALLVSSTNNTHALVQCFRYGFAAAATMAIAMWAPSVVTGVALAMPIILTVAVPLVMEQFGLQIAFKTQQAVEPPTVIASTVDVEPAISGCGQPDGPVAPVGQLLAHEDTEVDESEIDPWSTVREQFETDESLSRNIATWRDDDGNWSLVGNIRCQFATATETCIVHLPIWPIPDQAPEVFSRVAAGPAANIKATDVHPHGLRLEIKLDDLGQPAPIPDVLLEVVASITALSQEAAA